MKHQTVVAVRDLKPGDTLVRAGQVVVRVLPMILDRCCVEMKTTTGYPVAPVWPAGMLQQIWREE
jgi:hypothetical protein